MSTPIQRFHFALPLKSLKTAFVKLADHEAALDAVVAERDALKEKSDRDDILMAQACDKMDELRIERDTLRADFDAAKLDSDRLNWLETKAVNVRLPLVHGSRNLFWSSPVESEGEDDYPSELRIQIDAAKTSIP